MSSVFDSKQGVQPSGRLGKLARLGQCQCCHLGTILKIHNIDFRFSPSATLSSSPRPDPEQSPRPERVMSNMKAIDVAVASGELKKSIINKNNINSPQELTEVVPAADRKRDSKRHFFAYNGYTEVQLSKLFLFPGRGKKVATIRDPRGPDPDARGFNVPRNVGTLG